MTDIIAANETWGDARAKINDLISGKSGRSNALGVLAVANLDSITLQDCMWFVVGDKVTARGVLRVDPTATGTLTTADLDLPIANSGLFVSANDAIGQITYIGNGTNFYAGRVFALSNKLRMQFYPTRSVQHDIDFDVTYELF